MKEKIFISDEVTYLRFIINKCGISPSVEKTRDLLRANIPKNVIQLKSFLGMLNYYHRHLLDLAHVASSQITDRKH